MLDVKFYEVFDEEKVWLQRLLPINVKADFEKKTIQESSDRSIPAKLICIRTQSVIPLDWLKHIDGVLSRSQGYDHLIPLVQESAHKIKCGYLGSYCAKAVAEHAVVCMQMLLRKMKLQIKNFQTFDREGITGIQLADKKVLVVGVGNIGREIVRIVRNLGMNVKGVDVVQRMTSLKYESLSKGIRWADVIFCALPLTDQTKGLLNYQRLQSVGKGKYLINISRGEITPTYDLRNMLDDGILDGLSLDVYEQESEIAEYLRNPRQRKVKERIKIILELMNRDNVIFTPHNAFNTKEALQDKCHSTIEEMCRFIKVKKFRYPVRLFDPQLRSKY